MMKKILFIILFIILSMALTLNILSFSNSSFLNMRIYRVGSGSMEPYLKINSLILIKESNDYKINDIITYQNGDEYITHRIISINDDEVITKGDANNKEDDPITKDKIVGKLIYKFYVFGFISYLLTKPFTWILIFAIGLIITCLIPDKKEKNN